MTRTPNRGKKRPLHPVLKKMDVINIDQIGEEASDYFYDNPRSAEIIEWIADNITPILAPDGLRIMWWGEEPFSDGSNEPMAIFKKGGGSWMHGGEKSQKAWVDFHDRLVGRYPDVWEILDMVI